MVRAPPPGFFLISVIVLLLWFVIATRHMRPEPKVPQWRLKPLTADEAAALASASLDPLSSAPPLAAATSLPSSSAPIGGALPAIIEHGPVVAPKLNNETLKAELGRAAWKLFHTTFATFPDKPTKDQSEALKSYIYLFARLYPCGECAEHFKEIITRYPPQTSSRNTAAAWGCFVHNEVNRSKDKPEFDCSKIGDFYDCGCDKDDEEKEVKGVEVEVKEKGNVKSGQGGRGIDTGLFDGVEISKEGPINGG